MLAGSKLNLGVATPKGVLLLWIVRFATLPCTARDLLPTDASISKLYNLSKNKNPRRKIPSGLYYFFLNIRARANTSEMTRGISITALAILPFSICSSVGIISREPRTSHERSTAIKTANMTESIMHSSLNNLFTTIHL